MNRHTQHEIDETLQKKLEAYGQGAPLRKPEAEKRTRDRFMAELDHLTLGAIAPQPTSSTPGSIFMGWVTGLKQLKENLAMSFRQRSTMTILTVILVLAVFLFGGGGITAYAAGAALPGDALYPIKTGLENARVGFAEDPEAQARLFLGFAGNRLEEIRALVAEGRFTNVNGTASQFEKDLQQALDAIEKLSEKDPARAAELNAEAAQILKGYSDSLSALLAGVPEDVQPLIVRALNASQSAANSENSNSNSNDDNSNSNSNSNSNNDNSNLNSNDDNSNLNGNSNNNDDNSNSNSNSNSNDDNSNLNGNSNSSDDNSSPGGNSNSNDDNSNPGGNSNSNDDNSNPGGNSNSNDDNSNPGGNSNSNNDSGGNDNSGGGNDDNGGGGGGSDDNSGSGGG